MISEKIKLLIDSGLVRGKFVQEADDAVLASVEHFAKYYIEAAPGVNAYRRIGALMVQHGILTPELVENTILGNDELIVTRWVSALGPEASPKLEQFMADKTLGTPAVMWLLKNCHRPFTDGTMIERLGSILTPGASNAINLGITDIFEYEAIQTTSLRRGETRRDAFFTEQHRLLKAMRTMEHVSEKRQQVEAVVSADDPRPFRVQLEAVWQHYTSQSKLFREIGAEAPIPEDIRAQNVTCVNDWQTRKTRKAIQSPQQRFIDIYGRYNHSEMDPLMLALIARTVGWYVDNRHARLFTKVRLVPDRWGRMNNQTDSIPWAALVLSPKMSVLKVKGEAFRDSLRGANRLFLTHSLARDATDEQSIPIIGLAVWGNKSKFANGQPYALFCADFDQGDELRYGRKKWAWKGEDQAASIAGVMDETLRSLRQVEDLEIARAKDMPLRLGKDHRWTPSNRRPFPGVWQTIRTALSWN